MSGRMVISATHNHFANPSNFACTLSRFPFNSGPVD